MSETSYEKIDEQKPPSSQPNGTWKFWLGLAIFVAWVVLAQIEQSSSSARFHRQNAIGNAAATVYSDSVENCDPALVSAACDTQAAQDARNARERLGPLLGK